MLLNDTTWSDTEYLIAQAALKQAYHQEITALVDTVRHQAESITEVTELWHLHDFLSARRHDIDGKYDDRPMMLHFVLAKLYQEGLLSLGDLEGLTEDKITKIVVLSKL